MMDDEEQMRNRRIKQQSLVSMKLSKLPPRMEADAKKRQEQAEK
jgi:hypothetical protein